MTLDDKVLVEGVADQPRPDVGKALGTGGEHGFRFGSLSLSPKEVDRVVIQARPGPEHDWKPVKRRARRRAGQYQSFDDAKGGSKSTEKLKALALPQLKNRHSEATPLQGLSVLDIGCNEGFFCGEALRQGARRVVGIDMNNGFLERARKRFPEAEFRHGSWWDLPDEKFDVIFFLSAIHYEPRQRALLEKLASHLTPTGTLMLECGAIGGRARQVLADGPPRRRRPALSDLPDAAPRAPARLRRPLHGRERAAERRSDPALVFHCQLRSPTALLVSGALEHRQEHCWPATSRSATSRSCRPTSCSATWSRTSATSGRPASASPIGRPPRTWPPSAGPSRPNARRSSSTSSCSRDRPRRTCSASRARSCGTTRS